MIALVSLDSPLCILIDIVLFFSFVEGACSIMKVAIYNIRGLCFRRDLIYKDGLSNRKPNTLYKQSIELMGFNKRFAR